ncbi:hypothetical protein ACDX35_20265, partial [Enterobacter hormaechei]
MSETVNKIAILSSAVKHALLADVQYYDFHASSAFNRKMKGIITPGIYGGFKPALAGGLNLKITSLQGPGGHGVASVDVNNHQITVQQIEDVTLAIPVNDVTRVMLEANYQYGIKTSQVDDSSDIHAARIFTANISVPLADNHLEICRVTVPADATELTLDMIDSSHRQNKALGITLSSEIDSDADHIGASSHAVKKAVKAARDETEKQIEELVDNAPASLDTLKKIADAINNDPDFFNTLNAVLALKAPLHDPALTGIATVPTPPLSVSNKQIANTEYVQAAVAALVGSSPEALDTLAELANALNNDPNFATTVLNALAGKQPLDATLTALASLATGANKLPYFTGNDSVAQTDLTQVGRDILAKASIAAVIQYLHLEETVNKAAGAIQKSGDSMVGPLGLTRTSSFGVATENTLGGNSIAIGDSDSGFKSNGDGNIALMANSVLAGYFSENELQHHEKVLTKIFRAISTGNATEGAGGFGSQLTSGAPFYSPAIVRQNNDNNYFPLWKQIVSLQSGYPVAASMGLLTTGEPNFPQIVLHAKTDFEVNDKLWVFDVATGELRSPALIKAGEAVLNTNGDISGSAWGGALTNWLNSQLATRDANINARATVDWVNSQLATRDANINARATVDWVNSQLATRDANINVRATVD